MVHDQGLKDSSENDYSHFFLIWWQEQILPFLNEGVLLTTDTKAEAEYHASVQTLHLLTFSVWSPPIIAASFLIDKNNGRQQQEACVSLKH